jgi:uncharacterized membrane protein YagU involved in acid resistance
MHFVRLAACGALAGAAGTIAMDLLWYLRYRRGGGTDAFVKWEFGSPPKSWDDAGAPAQVGKLLYETFTHTELSVEYAGLVTNLMHWAYGSQWGVASALALETSSRTKLKQGPLLGLIVWLASYVSLPIAGFYKPIWQYDLKTLAKDLSAHLVYGTGTVAAFKLLRVESDTSVASSKDVVSLLRG